ncbi:MAG: hypothetical protein J7527_14570 [Chitinophagaceae bacterium]|nr:hypothetical protein [Chitinophagaceae bacterium]
MKKENATKIIRQGNTTVIIAHDPEGEFARKISGDIYSQQKLEQAKQTLRECPLPDHILEPYRERMLAEEEKLRRIAEANISQ